MTIKDRYARAVHSSNLRQRKQHEHIGDTDVLGAYGIADKRLTTGENDRPPSPLSVPLERLFMGDNNAGHEVVLMLAEMGWKQARRLDIKCTRMLAEQLAKACLAWHRNGNCKPCGGHGVAKIPGTNVLGTSTCGVCRGSGRILFEKNVHPAEVRPLAAWMVSEIERAQAKAGPAALRALAETFCV